MNEEELIEGCLNGSLRHQRMLYERYAPKMMGLCMRYAASEAEAEDMLQEGFVTIFRKLESYAGRGELGAWIRRVVLNSALMTYRKNRKFQMQVDMEGLEYFMESDDNVFSRLSARDLMYMVQQLPAGYRIVFNLYAIEGYTHPEIAQQLDISVGTSKSQYSRARAMLRQMIANEEKRVSGTAIR